MLACRTSSLIKLVVIVGRGDVLIVGASSLYIRRLIKSERTASGTVRRTVALTVREYFDCKKSRSEHKIKTEH